MLIWSRYKRPGPITSSALLDRMSSDMQILFGKTASPFRSILYSTHLISPWAWNVILLVNKPVVLSDHGVATVISQLWVIGSWTCKYKIRQLCFMLNHYYHIYKGHAEILYQHFMFVVMAFIKSVTLCYR